MSSRLKKLTALLLSGAMVMGMGMTSFAEEGTTEEKDATIQVEKILQLPEGMKVPDLTFTFKADPIQAEETEGAAEVGDTPQAEIAPAEFNNTIEADEVDSTPGLFQASMLTDVTFGTFPHAGVYAYDVSEEGVNDKGVTYDGTHYTMKVFVANKADEGTYISSILIFKTVDGQEVKTENGMVFTNTYENHDAVLTISKAVDGDLADRSKEFEYTINFKDSVLKAAGTTYNGVITKDGEKVSDFSYSETNGVFQLAHGETLTISNLPVGTKYTVTETGAAGYTPSVKLTENGNPTENSAKAGEALTAKKDGSILIGEEANIAAYTNTSENIPLTGVIINNLPFIILIGAAVCVLGVLVAVKRRRA